MNSLTHWKSKFIWRYNVEFPTESTNLENCTYNISRWIFSFHCFTSNVAFLFPRGFLRHISPRFFAPALAPCLSSHEPTHFTVSDLRLATRGITELGNYRGSDYLASRREIIACDVSSAATYRAKIPLRGRSFLPNCSRYCAILFLLFQWQLQLNFIQIPGERSEINYYGKVLTVLITECLSKFIIK